VLLTLPWPKSLRHALTQLTHRTKRLYRLTGAKATAIGAASTLIVAGAAVTLAAAGAPTGSHADAGSRPPARVPAISPTHRRIKNPPRPNGGRTAPSARRRLQHALTVARLEAHTGTAKEAGDMTTTWTSRGATASRTTALASATSAAPHSPAARPPTHPTSNHPDSSNTAAGTSAPVAPPPVEPPLAPPAPAANDAPPPSPAVTASTPAPPAPQATDNDPNSPTPESTQPTPTPTPPTETDAALNNPQDGATSDHGTVDGTTPGADPEPPAHGRRRK
jgi:hypothetical protein